jgi:hypothetical protein
MFKFTRSAVVALTCLAAIACSSVGGEAASCPGADAVKKAASSFVRAAETGSPAAFASALARHTNTDQLALFALGKYRDRLPAARRDEYISNARRFMSQFLASNADRFRWSSLVVESCKGNLIQTSLDHGSDLTWRVAGERIEDVRISGFWLTLQLRSKFTGIIQREHGDVSALLDYLARVNVAAK